MAEESQRPAWGPRARHSHAGVSPAVPKQLRPARMGAVARSGGLVDARSMAEDCELREHCRQFGRYTAQHPSMASSTDIGHSTTALSRVNVKAGVVHDIPSVRHRSVDIATAVLSPPPLVLTLWPSAFASSQSCHPSWPCHRLCSRACCGCSQLSSSQWGVLP